MQSSLHIHTAIVSSHYIEVSPMQVFNLSCTAPCGLLAWRINSESTDHYKNGNGSVVVESDSTKLCSGGNCVITHIFQCSSATEGKFLERTIMLRAREDFVIQCEAQQLTIGNAVHKMYSKVTRVVVIKPPEPVAGENTLLTLFHHSYNN